MPYEALAAAIVQGEQITPLLLDALEQAAADPGALLAQSDDYFLPIFAMYLLAQFEHDMSLLCACAGASLSRPLPGKPHGYWLAGR